MKKLMIGALGALLLSGCVGMRDITASDIRKPEYASATTHINKSVQQVSQALFEHATDCRSFGSISVDPTGSKRVVVALEGKGGSRSLPSRRWSISRRREAHELRLLPEQG